MQQNKQLSVCLIMSSLILVLSSCAYKLPNNQFNSYTTQIRVSPEFPLKYYTKFDVYHTGGKKIGSCLRKIDDFASVRIKFIIHAPCIYSNQLQNLWLTSNASNASLKSLAEKLLIEIPSLFNSFGLNDDIRFSIQIVLTPKDHTYHFKKSLWQTGKTKAFIGLAVDLENQNNLKLASSLLDTTVHELTHVFDIINKGTSKKLELEKTAHLAGYCASIALGIHKNKTLEGLSFITDRNIFKQLIEKNISDDNIENIIKLNQIGDGVDQWVKLDVNQLAVFVVQKQLYELLDNYDEQNLDNQQIERVTTYCNARLRSHFAEEL